MISTGLLVKKKIIIKTKSHHQEHFPTSAPVLLSQIFFSLRKLNLEENAPTTHCGSFKLPKFPLPSGAEQPKTSCHLPPNGCHPGLTLKMAEGGQSRLRVIRDIHGGEEGTDGDTGEKLPLQNEFGKLMTQR